MSRDTDTSPARQGPPDLVRVLLEERPSLHGQDVQAPVNWQLGDQLLHWLDEHLPDGARTLETGCGYSTLVFASRAAHHTVVSPIGAEHDRVRAWCDEHGLDHTSVRFVCEPSQAFLPRAWAASELGELDLILIDGDHAYPAAGIDWYYSAPALKVGGLLIVDDIAIRACGHLADFLAAEKGLWESVATLSDATVFRKASPAATEFRPWDSQPWNRRRVTAADVVQRVKSRTRIRSRIRARRSARTS
ncbi:MAG TPA: class I SAM-dependent methyltransferase [Acidimicrobiales bacterium]|jgi:predicted O-methyltransferase YrrM|nr:class I SAM-dependent methyltransferase [Acidimicrobiales bacterium]